MYDLVLLNGNVNFGDSSKSKKLNIGITGEKISYIGTDTINGKESIDSTGY